MRLHGRTRIPRSTITLLTAIVLASTLHVDTAVAAPEYGVYAVDAESFHLPAGAKRFTNRSATGRAAVSFTKRATAWREVLIPSGSRFVLRARGKSCGGIAPRVTVRLSGRTVMSTSVRAPRWTGYSRRSTQPGGKRKLSISFDNAGTVGGCVRRLSVDALTVLSDRPINAGTPGGICQATDVGRPRLPLAKGWRTTGLAGAPGYYETAPPSGSDGAKRPVGVMLLIHSGGWFTAGPGAVATMRPSGERWRARGWHVVSMTSERSCGRWVSDTVRFYDAITEKWPDLPVCALGQSAGGHLAMMLAVKRASLDCAINEGGPTDLVNIHEQRAYSPVSSQGQTIGPAAIRWWVAAALGKDKLAQNSPALYADSIKAKVVMAITERDVFIPPAQLTEAEQALDEAKPLTPHKALILEHGGTRWVHGSISEEAYEEVEAYEEAVASPPQTDDVPAYL